MNSEFNEAIEYICVRCQSTGKTTYNIEYNLFSEILFNLVNSSEKMQVSDKYALMRNETEKMLKKRFHNDFSTLLRSAKCQRSTPLLRLLADIQVILDSNRQGDIHSASIRLLNEWIPDLDVDAAKEWISQIEKENKKEVSPDLLQGIKWFNAEDWFNNEITHAQNVSYFQFIAGFILFVICYLIYYGTLQRIFGLFTYFGYLIAELCKIVALYLILLICVIQLMPIVLYVTWANSPQIICNKIPEECRQYCETLNFMIQKRYQELIDLRKIENQLVDSFLECDQCLWWRANLIVFPYTMSNLHRFLKSKFRFNYGALWYDKITSQAPCYYGVCKIALLHVLKRCKEILLVLIDDYQSVADCNSNFRENFRDGESNIQQFGDSEKFQNCESSDLSYGLGHKTQS